MEIGEYCCMDKHAYEVAGFCKKAAEPPIEPFSCPGLVFFFFFYPQSYLSYILLTMPRLPLLF